MAELLPLGLQTEIEVDPTQGDRDRHGRLLHYVFLPNASNSAEVMIREGLGHRHTHRCCVAIRTSSRPPSETPARRHAGSGRPWPAAGVRLPDLEVALPRNRNARRHVG